LARGINLHVRRSSGEGHGPQGEVPESVSLDDLETVGTREVRMEYPEDRTSDSQVRLCPYCNQTFAGIEGLMIHLGQMAGRENHPADPKRQHRPRDFPPVDVDEDGNVGAVTETPPVDGTERAETGAVPVARVFHLVAELIADGDVQTAQRVRRTLIGAEPERVPEDGDTASVALYEAFLREKQRDDTENRVAAELQSGSILVSCRDTSARLTPNEARLEANHIEGVADKHGNEVLRELAEFLRYGADILDWNQLEQAPQREFQEWR
jgi:hypothetical protein